MAQDTDPVCLRRDREVHSGVEAVTMTLCTTMSRNVRLVRNVLVDHFDNDLSLFVQMIPR